MKKLICLVAVFTSLSCYAQKEKWSVSVSSGFGFGGPSASIKSQMNKQHYNDTYSSNFLDYTWTKKYPRVISGSSLAFLSMQEFHLEKKDGN